MIIIFCTLHRFLKTANRQNKYCDGKALRYRSYFTLNIIFFYSLGRKKTTEGNEIN